MSRHREGSRTGAQADEFRGGVRLASGQFDGQRELAVLRSALRHRSLRARVDELLEEFDLARLRNTKCGLLSSGEQTRAALAKALLNKPTLLLLDEPTASLDPSAAQIIREKNQKLASRDGCGILWTSHNMHEVQSVCDRVLFLSHGKVLLEGDPRLLPQAHGASSLEELFIRVAREPLAGGEWMAVAADSAP